MLLKPRTRVFPLPRMASDTQFVWPSNTPPLIVPSLPCQTTSRIDSQFPNAPLPTLVTLAGISTRRRLWHWPNTFAAIVLTDVPIVAFVSA